MPYGIISTGNHPDATTIADGPNLDAFSRLRISSPSHVFDGQFTYDIQPLLYEPIIAQARATVAHDATNRCALCTFSTTPTGGAAYLQTFQYFPYQPGRSQQVFITFNFIEPKADCLKFAGYSDGVNGIELQQAGATVQLKLYSGTTNGDQTVAQTDWNLDKLNGYGPSKHTLDLTKAQILVIDFQALYVGRVRVGFDIDGVLYYVHQFVHANHIATPYIQTANLPIRCGMTCTGTVSTTMRFICASVTSEGGNADAAGYDFTQEGSVTAASGARAHLLSIQRKTTFNSLVNRMKFIVQEVSILNLGNNPVLWELVIGDVLSGTTAFNDVNASYSGTQYNVLGTTSGSPAIVCASGYVGSTNQQKGMLSVGITPRYPTALSAAGVVRDMARYTLLVTGIGGTSACRGSLSWREIR